MNVEDVEILQNTLVGPSCYKLELAAAWGAGTASPGQFVMIRVPGGLDPLLRRPFSIYHACDTDSGAPHIEVLYKVVGRGTEKFSHLKKGETLNLLGPLGKGFAMPNRKGPVYLVAGGIGIAPMYFLVQQLLKKGWPSKDIILFFGARSKAETALLTDFEKLTIAIHVTTDDGSRGQKGVVTEYLKPHLVQNPPEVMYACGPTPMLRAVASLAEVYKVSCQVSLETAMACGMGACLGCAVKNGLNADKYVHVCMDGPVFDLAEFRF